MKRFFKKNAPMILSCLSALGVIGTSVLTAKATIKAKDRLYDIDDPYLTKKDYVRLFWKEYIPSALAGATTISVIFMTNTLSKKQQMALNSAYLLIANSFNEYKKKVKELYGDDSHENIIKSISFDKPFDDDRYICDKTGFEFRPEDYGEYRLFRDSMSDRYFESTIEQVMEAEYNLNRNLVLKRDVSLNEFYDFLGIEPVEFGDEIGWKIDEDYIYWIDFSHYKTVTDDGLECYIIDTEYPPAIGYLEE